MFSGILLHHSPLIVVDVTDLPWSGQYIPIYQTCDPNNFFFGLFSFYHNQWLLYRNGSCLMRLISNSVLWLFFIYLYQQNRISYQWHKECQNPCTNPYTIQSFYCCLLLFEILSHVSALNIPPNRKSFYPRKLTAGSQHK